MKAGIRTVSALLIALSLLLSTLPKISATPLSPPLPELTASQADAPEPPQPAATQLPPGASTDWWTTVQRNIQQSEYEITWQDQSVLPDIGPGYQAPNRTQNLRTYFAPDGIRVIPRKFDGDQPPWTLGLRLVSINGQAVDAPVLSASGHRIEYARGSLTEWYANDEQGLEQGFALAAPVSAPRGGISVELALSGDLIPSVAAGAAAIEFATPSGDRVLRYAGLRALDAAGRGLPAHIELDQAVIALRVDDTDAVYPVTLDPTITSLSAQAGQPGAVTALQVDGTGAASFLTLSQTIAGLSNSTNGPDQVEQAGAQLGFSVATAGDVNHDGYADIIVGAPFFDNGQSDAGSALVFLGAASGMGTSAAWSAESNQAFSGFGWSVATAGDVNGDGCAEVIVGARDYDKPENAEGVAFVYFGSPDGLGDPGLPTNADWTAEANQVGAELGQSVGTAGDVNRDGYADVIVGAWGYDKGQEDEGLALVYFGGPNGLGDPGTPANADWTAESDQVRASFAEAVGTAGDVNGDGYADVIAGGYSYDNTYMDAGIALVFYGGPSGLGDPGTPANADWMAQGDQSITGFGSSLGTAGDVNGDGYAEVIVGADVYDAGQYDEGRAYLYYGSGRGLSTTAGWTAESNQNSAQFGYSVGTAGDLNGDGYAEVIVGARWYDDGETDEGGAFVYYGGPGGLGDLGTPGNADRKFESNQAGAKLGSSVGTAGDVNGDGYADVVLGAPNYDDTQADDGMAVVYYGQPWTVTLVQPSAQFGFSVGTAGDVNRDGYADMVVGAPLYDVSQADQGIVCIFPGSASGLLTTPWTIGPGAAGAEFGYSAGTAGDVNGDGYSDIVAGAPYFNNGVGGEGQVRVYLGSASGPNTTSPWSVTGTQGGAHFGWSVGTAGDVNGDGYADVIAGAPLYDSAAETDEGAAWVYPGSASGMSASPLWSAESHNAGAQYGLSVGTAGDVNGDGYADAIVGAPFYDGLQTDAGGVFVYVGSAGGLSWGWTIERDQASTEFGWSVSTAGDVNGDGYADIIVGAPYYSNGQGNEGAAFVYRGSASGLNSDWGAESNQTNANFGYSVGTAGDVNGDGYADVIMGAPYFDNGQNDEGRTFVYLGKSAAGLDWGWTAESNQANANFGWSVGTAGDVNGDGYSDVVSGAYLYDGASTVADGGAVFVYPGRVRGLSTTPGWTAESDQEGADFGYSVGAAGDVNGDGYADVIVGAPHYDSGQPDDGAAFVYLGSASGLSPTYAWIRFGGAAGCHFGWSVSGAGDVNGDGYADVIVGAPLYGWEEEGFAFLYHGSASGPSSGPPDWLGHIGSPNANFGHSVGTAGDVNGDGYADVIVGAPYFTNGSPEEGAAFVYLGSASGLSTERTWGAETNLDGARYGWSVGTAGDINGDSYSDIIVGAPLYGGEGLAFGYLGSASGPSGSPWVLGSSQADAEFGWSVGTAGYVNGDGYSDVIVGAWNYSNDQAYEGRAFVYLGSAGGITVPAAWTAESNQAYSQFGRSAATAGDVNGDGYSDVIVGASIYNRDEHNDEGWAFVYLGGPSGLGAAPAWTAAGDQASAYLGWSAGTAGDVNGDGYSDVIVGAFGYDNGEADEGAAFLYYGAGKGLAVEPQQRHADDSAPVAPGGQTISPNTAVVRSLLRTPFGRSNLGVQFEVKPVGLPLDGTSPTLPQWGDGGTGGANLKATLDSLLFETRYHWRMRILGRPYHAATNSAVTYRSRWIAGSTFFTALSGVQAIAGTGQTNLLEQSAYANVSSRGSPALTSLTLRGYPNTLPPNYAAIPGYGAGSQVLPRYFSITPNDDAAGYSLTLCLNYDDGEVTAANATEANLQLCRWHGAGWVCYPRAAASSTDGNLACAEAVAQLSNWAIAYAAPCAGAGSIRATPAIVGGTVQLSWGSGGAADIYRDAMPYFTPASPYAAGVTSPWTDSAGAVGNTGANYSYVVMPSGCVAPASQRAGDFDFALTKGQ